MYVACANLHCSALSKDAKTCLDLEAEIVTTASFPAKELGEVLALECDVAIPAQVKAAIEAVDARFGRVDALVNVPFLFPARVAPHELPLEAWNAALAVNLTGHFLCCQAAMAGMKRLQFGRIINLGSVVGKNSGNARPWINPDEQAVAGNLAYGASKAGVHMLTGFLARELAAHGITVNALAPGPIATGMTTGFPPALRALIPRGRMGTPDDVAQIGRAHV